VVTRLERRARLLLRAYPPDYRADRAEEMLGTLLEAARPGQEWPSVRDARSFLRGGVAARAARNRRLGLRTSLRQAATLGLVLYVSQVAATWVSFPLFLVGASFPLFRAGASRQALQELLMASLLVAAFLAVWTGRRVVVAICGAAGIVVTVYSNRGDQSPPGHQSWWTVPEHLAEFVPVTLTMLALIALTRRHERLPRSWLLLACLPVAVSATLALLIRHGRDLRDLFVAVMDTLPVRGDIVEDAFLLVTVGCVGWLVTDTRPALGVALFFVLAQVADVFFALQPIVTGNAPFSSLWQWDLTVLEQLVAAAFLMVVAVWILRWRTRARRGTMS
jgi:hypothetical protein